MPRKMKVEKSLEAIKKRWVRGDIAMKALQAPIVSNASLSAVQQEALENALRAAGILKAKSSIQTYLALALSDAIFYTKKPFLSYNQKKLTRQSFGTDRPSGPHQKDVARLVLCAALFRAWRQYFDEEPTVSRPLTPKLPNAVRSQFVRFARDIFRIAQMRKVEDRLLAYRTYESELGLHKSLSKKQISKKTSRKK
jgi:hypothetical protein